MKTPPNILRFDTFELDYSNRQLNQYGQPVALSSRYFDALALLVTRSGELVTKDAFMDHVWQGVPVTDEALTQCIRAIRKALRDDASNPRFIETVPKHGYRFVADMPLRADTIACAYVPHIAGACTLAGLAAGGVAGLIYGIIAGTGGGAQVLILSAMIGVLGLLAGAGLGAGMAAAVAWRGCADRWVIAGAATGGLVIGALGNLIGREGVGLLSGVSIASVTGPFEGLVIGTVAGFAGWVALVGYMRRVVMATSVLGGSVATVVIIISGGTLLAGSLHALETSLSGIQLAMATVGNLLGQQGLTPIAFGFTVLVESQIFIFAIAMALLSLRNGCQVQSA